MFRALHHGSRFVDTPRLSEAARHRGRDRIFGLDLVRSLAIILVIAEHTILLDGSAATKWLIPLLAPNAPLFFILSGALLLPVSRKTGAFIRKRAARVLIPYTFWSFIFAWLTYHFLSHNIDWLASQIRWFWLRPVFEEAWFIPILFAMYLFYPVITPWVRTASLPRFRYFIILWALALCLPFVASFINIDNDALDRTMLGTFYGCLGYAVAGVCLMRYPLLPSEGRRRQISVLILLAIIGFIVPYIILAVPALSGNFSDVMPRAISVTTAAASLLIFSLLAPVKLRGHAHLRAAVAFLARISFVMYFIQPVLTRFIFPSYTPGLMDSPWLFPITLAATIIIALPIRLIPLLRKFLA